MILDSSCGCRFPCKQTTFPVSISSALFPSVNYWAKLGEKLGLTWNGTAITEQEIMRLEQLLTATEDEEWRLKLISMLANIKEYIEKDSLAIR